LSYTVFEVPSRTFLALSPATDPVTETHITFKPLNKSSWLPAGDALADTTVERLEALHERPRRTAAHGRLRLAGSATHAREIAGRPDHAA
jgi:hypothetical protein